MVGIAITRSLAHTATYCSECRPPSAWIGSKCVSKASSTSSSINVCLLPACFRNAVAKVGGNSKFIWTICGTIRLSVVQLSVMAPAQKLCRRPYLNTCLTISPDKARNQVSVQLQTAEVPCVNAMRRVLRVPERRHLPGTTKRLQRAASQDRRVGGARAETR